MHPAAYLRHDGHPTPARGVSYDTQRHAGYFNDPNARSCESFQELRHEEFRAAINNPLETTRQFRQERFSWATNPCRNSHFKCKSSNTHLLLRSFWKQTHKWHCGLPKCRGYHPRVRWEHKSRGRASISGWRLRPVTCSKNQIKQTLKGSGNLGHANIPSIIVHYIYKYAIRLLTTQYTNAEVSKEATGIGFKSLPSWGKLLVVVCTTGGQIGYDAWGMKQH